MNIRLILNYHYKQVKMMGFFLFGLLMLISTIFPFEIGESFADDSGNVYKTSYINKNQAKLLKLAFKYGTKIGYPETLEAILLQESNAGTAPLVGDVNQSVGRRSYGRMQIKVAEVRNILYWYPELESKYFNNKLPSQILDEEIIVLLLTNDEANIEIASKVFAVKIKESKGNWARAVASYNLGSYGAKNITLHSKFPYVVSIDKKIHNIVRPFNEHIGLNGDNIETKKIAELHVQPKKVNKKVKHTHVVKK